MHIDLPITRTVFFNTKSQWFYSITSRNFHGKILLHIFCKFFSTFPFSCFELSLLQFLFRFTLNSNVFVSAFSLFHIWHASKILNLHLNDLNSFTLHHFNTHKMIESDVIMFSAALRLFTLECFSRISFFFFFSLSYLSFQTIIQTYEVQTGEVQVDQ